LRPPRVSQIPSSGWSQCAHTQLIVSAIARQPLVADLQTVRVAEEHPVHGLAVDVELEVVGRLVPDANGAGAPPALEMVQRPLGQVG
jgi:hypothetical protein